MLVFVTLVAVWLGIEVNRGRRQQAAIATIRREGGTIYHRGQSGRIELGVKTDAPAWLVKQLGDGFFGEVEILQGRLTDEGMRSIAGLGSIRELNPFGATDKTLEPIAGLTTLVALNLAHSNITDQGLRTIGTLPRLKVLDLSSCTHITDAGLREIKDLELEKLDLYGTSITGGGLNSSTAVAERYPARAYSGREG